MNREENALRFVKERNENENIEKLEKIITILKQKQLEEEAILAAILQNTLYKTNNLRRNKRKYGEKPRKSQRMCKY